MNRRTLLVSAIAFGVVPALPRAASTAATTIDYTPGLIDEALAAGKTVFVDYAASWCSTCRRQARVIEDLRAQNPAYDAAMMFVRVDWDSYREHEITIMHQVPRRSTLLLLRGEEELGRIVAETGVARIKALMDKGLEAPADG